MTFSIVYPRDIERLRVERRAIVVDIRSRDEYRRGHWQGAINYPQEEVADYTSVLTKQRLVILYCERGGSSMQLARDLGKAGYEVGTVIGGYEAMKKLENRFS